MAWFALPKALRAELLGVQSINQAVSGRIHYQELPQSSQYPHVWFARTSRQTDRDVSGQPLLTEERFTLEIVGNSDCEALVDAIFDTLEAFSEVLSDGRDVQLIEVEDADDDYVFQSVGEGEPDYLHALSVAVYSSV